MSSNQKHTGPAPEYAQALIELANDTQSAEAVGQELEQLRQLMQDDAGFAAFLRDPGISPAERAPIFERVLKAQLTPLMFNFLGVLNSKNRLGLLERIAQVYKDMLDKQLGRIDVEMTVSQPLDGVLMEEVRAKIAAALKMIPTIHQRVDASILGGMVLRVEDRLIDGSVRQQLASIKQQMLEGAR